MSNEYPASPPPTKRNARDDLIAAAIRLLNDNGPDALQTRKIAAAADTSTMALYTYFGGMQALIAEIVEIGRTQLRSVVADVTETDDPIADFMVAGMAYRKFAIDNPHMYRLMFGMASAHGINTPGTDVLGLPNFCEPLFHCVRRSFGAGRIVDRSADNAAKVLITAAKFWTVMHGFVTLELSGYWGTGDNAVGPILVSLSSNLLVGLGDTPEEVGKSAVAALQRVTYLNQDTRLLAFVPSRPTGADGED